jgi:hypothetical protein
MFTVIADGKTDIVNVCFKRATERAHDLTTHGAKVVVRRSTPAEVRADQERASMLLAVVERITSATQGQHSVVAPGGYVRSNAVYSSTML